MKEYEKWVFGSASNGWIRDEFTGAEEGWKAALKWILSWENDAESIEIIKRELGEEK